MFETILTGDFSGLAFDNVAPKLISATNRVSLRGEYMLGGSGEASIYNLANAGLPLVPHGTPIYHPGYAELGVGGWFDTGLPDVANLTIIVASAVLTAPNGWLVTSYGQGSNHFTNFDLTADALRGLAATGDGAQLGYQTPSLTPDRTSGGPLIWSVKTFRTHQIDANSFQLQVDEFKDGIRLGGGSQAIAKARAVSDKMFTIGSAAGMNDVGNTIAIAAVAIIHDYLTDSAIQAEYQTSVRQRLAAAGIDA